jgi:hypothetical protein
MEHNFLVYESEDETNDFTPMQEYRLEAMFLRFDALSVMSDGVEVFCLNMSFLILLTIQIQQIDIGSSSQSSFYFKIANAVLRYVVSVGSFLVMTSGIASGIFVFQEAALFEQAANACNSITGASTDSSESFLQQAKPFDTKHHTCESVQMGTEALLLLILSIVFIVVVVERVAHYRRVELLGASALEVTSSPRSQNMNSNTVDLRHLVLETLQLSADQRRRLTVACFVVALTFPSRTAFQLLNAYSLFESDSDSKCDPCAPCQSDPILIQNWIFYTPEFGAIVVALSSPITISFSLWSITSGRQRNQKLQSQAEELKSRSTCVGTEVALRKLRN